METTDDQEQYEPHFKEMLQFLITKLCEWAQNTTAEEITQTPIEQRPVSQSMWSILRKVGVEFLVNLFLPAIPREVQQVFVAEKCNASNLLSLAKVQPQDIYQGIYADLPVRNEEVECYIGSTSSLKRRMAEHLGVVAKKDVEALAECHRKSFHYRFLSDKNTKANFRKLAIFRNPIPTGYLIILESVFMIMLQSYNDPGYYATYSTRQSYRMVKNLREQIELPTMPWCGHGLNAAWPLRQGLTSRGNAKPLPCSNTECQTMTFPRYMMPEGPKCTRALFNSLDPLGGYICRRCDSYKERHGHLPDNATLVNLVSKFVKETEKSNLRQAGKDVICEICGVVEGADGALNSCTAVILPVFESGIVGTLCCCDRICDTLLQY